MTQDHATPVPVLVRTLAIVRASTEAGPAAVQPVPDASTDPATEPGPVPTAPVPMPVPERARLAVTHWAGTAANGAGQLWLRPGRVLYVLWHPEPETMAAHRAYVRSMAWVPPELAGKAATAIKWAGILYHILIGHPLIAAMEGTIKTAKNIQVAAARPLRLLMLVIFASALILILLHL